MRPLLPLLSMLGAACGSGEGPSTTGADALVVGRYAEPPNVLLVTIDTLRADHLGCYGYRRPTTPRIDALAVDGVRFERAIATSGTTLPSHLSIMTGLWPHQHGYVANKGAIKGPFQSAPGRRTAAEFFRDAGYVTAAYVSGTTVKKTTGIQVGFDTFDQPETINRLGELTVEGALRWLELFARYGKKPGGRGRPFFLWVHLWDPHEPNTPPEPYASMFASDVALDDLIAERHVDPGILAAGFPPLELARLFFPELAELLHLGEEVEIPELGAGDVRRLYNLYDGDVRYADDQVGRLLDGLHGLGLGGDTIFALTADHGQALGQHDWLEHGRIQVENVHVPMIVRFPDQLVPQPRVVERVVSTVDLLPTIFARIDRPAAAAFLEQASGEDVLAALHPRPFAFSHRSERDRTNWEPGRKFGVTVDGWKYYRLDEQPDQLFDFTTDPGELVDVAAEHPELVAQFASLVEGILSQRPAAAGSEGSSTGEERRAYEAELRSLGYLGSDE